MSLPQWLCELRQRKVVHDGDVDKLLGVVDDGQDGGKVVGATAGRYLSRGTLQVRTWAEENSLSRHEELLNKYQY